MTVEAKRVKTTFCCWCCFSRDFLCLTNKHLWFFLRLKKNMWDYSNFMEKINPEKPARFYRFPFFHPNLKTSKAHKKSHRAKDRKTKARLGELRRPRGPPPRNAQEALAPLKSRNSVGKRRLNFLVLVPQWLTDV